MLVTQLPTLLNSTYDAAEQLKVQVAKALTNAEMYPNSKPAIDAFFDGVAGNSGGGDNPLPEVGSGLVIGALTLPPVAVGGVTSTAQPPAYAFIDAAAAGGEVEVSYAAVPAGTLPGYPGAVSFASSSAPSYTGVTEGLAVISVQLSFGSFASGVPKQTLSTYYSVTVTGGA